MPTSMPTGMVQADAPNHGSARCRMEVNEPMPPSTPTARTSGATMAMAMAVAMRSP